MISRTTRAPTTDAATIPDPLCAPFWGAAVAGLQPTSSDPSLQSLTPLHRMDLEIHLPFDVHRNWSDSHGRLVGKILVPLVRQSGEKTMSSTAISLMYELPTTPSRTILSDPSLQSLT